MPQVHCLEWLDDDPDLGMREDGFSLHLTKADADAFAAEHQSASCVADPEGAYGVEVPDDLYDEVRDSRDGIRRTHPREPSFPRARAGDGLDDSWESSRGRGRDPDGSAPVRIPLPRVGGRYQLTSLVQRWEWGDAFAARDIQTTDSCVVKIGANSRWAPAFQHAHESIVAVDHGAFVRSVETGLMDDGRPYIVEEPIRGSTLLDLRRERPLSTNHVLDVIGAIAEGLSAAHRKGVFWFDIEPSKTVLRERDGQWLFHEPRLTDSQLSHVHILARSPADAGQGNMLGSTYRGLSPEEIGGKEKVPATDVYRLGSLGFFALVGRLPFAADTATASFFRILHEEAAFPADPSIPEPVQDLILHCLCTDPEARPPNGQAALEAIDDVRES